MTIQYILFALYYLGVIAIQTSAPPHLCWDHSNFYIDGEAYLYNQHFSAFHIFLLTIVFLGVLVTDSMLDLLPEALAVLI